MVIVEKLIGKRGDVRILLGCEQSGIFDLSNSEDWRKREVLDNLVFAQVTVKKVEIFLNFVTCTFTESSFEQVQATRCFWGANDVWNSCLFKQARLREMISPMNSFHSCRFEEMELSNFQPYQTLFENCTFTACKIEGMCAQTVLNRNMVNPKLSPADSNRSVVFRRCRFEQTKFAESYFAGIAFEDCQFDLTTADHCDFTGVQSETIWWNTQKGDPFTVFISKVLEFIGRQCGKNSRAHEVFERYVLDYGTGKTTSKDFSACLYSNKVPDSELEQIEKDLPKLMAKFPF